MTRLLSIDQSQLPSDTAFDRGQRGCPFTAVFLLHVVASTVIGTCIYVLFRTETLLVFRWIDNLGLTQPVMAFRAALTLLSRFSVVGLHVTASVTGPIRNRGRNPSSIACWVSDVTSVPGWTFAMMLG